MSSYMLTVVRPNVKLSVNCCVVQISRCLLTAVVQMSSYLLTVVSSKCEDFCKLLYRPNVKVSVNCCIVQMSSYLLTAVSSKCQGIC